MGARDMVALMPGHEPIAYVYDADHHCPECAEERFGRDAHGDITGTDGEGNEVGIIAPWDDSWADNARYEGRRITRLGCGTCLRTIAVVRIHRADDATAAAEKGGIDA